VWFKSRLGVTVAGNIREAFQISRKTGYKIWNRYQTIGLSGLTDRSRRPVRYANQLPIQIEASILKIKAEWPNWGAPKIRAKLMRKYPDIRIPAKSTVHAILDRHGKVNKKRRRRNKAQGTALSLAENPNELWCADYKGEFMLGNKKYCYPLTITDQSSRYILGCEALETTKEKYAFGVFERVFKEYGLPNSIRTDNGVPFASPNALFGLSKLSVWWLRLGIDIERIKPGNPQQNGRHERMHLTLKQDTTRPPGMNTLQQQDKFETFIKAYNEERPHQGLKMNYPSDYYTPSKRKYEGITPIEYPFHDRTILVTICGRICIKKLKINFSTVFSGQAVGIKEVHDKIWLVSYMDYDLGYFDEDSSRFEPLNNPFGPKLLPMSSV